jgi:hypothetical protein
MFVIRVDDGNGVRVVETTPWTIRQWELHMKTRLSKIVDRGFGMDDYMFLAWRQLKDENTIDEPFEKWAPKLVVCEITGGEGELIDPNSLTPSEALDD